MKIFQNIKLQYHIKEIEDHLQNSQIDNLKIKLSNLYNNSPKIFYLLFKHFFNQFLQIRSTEKLFSENIVLINSFNANDRNIIIKFLKYYFEHIQYDLADFNKFENNFIHTSKKFYQETYINFEKIIEDSILFQIIWGFDFKNKYLFLENGFAFFSSANNYNFCDNNTINSYFLVIEHPYKIFSFLKSKLGSKDLAKNYMFNLDSRNEIYDYENTKLEIIKKDWTTYNTSWFDPNVQSSLKGAIIKKEDLLLNPMETYASLILHLRQCGHNIALKYDLIEKYLEINTEDLINQSKVDDISNNDKKFIQKYCQILTEQLEFDL